MSVARIVIFISGNSLDLIVNIVNLDTVGRNKKAIQEYVRNQLQEDIAADQTSLKEFTDSFMGKLVSKGK